MTTDLENRIRASLRDRADDVEPTPELWQAVARRTTRRRAVPYLAWTAAGAAGVLVMTTVVPNLLDSTERSVTVAPVGEAPGPITGAGEDAFVTEIPNRYVAAVGWQIVLRSLDGSVAEQPLIGSDGGDILSVEVRPGSTVDDLVLAYTERTPEGIRLTIGRVTPGSFDRLSTVELPSTGEVEPQAVWSPDGQRLAWTTRDGATGWVLNIAEFVDAPGSTLEVELLPDERPNLGDAYVVQDWDVVGDREEIVATAADGRGAPMVIQLEPGTDRIQQVEPWDVEEVERASLPRILDVVRTGQATTVLSRDDVEVSIDTTMHESGGGHGTRWPLEADEYVSITGVGGAVLVAADGLSALAVSRVLSTSIWPWDPPSGASTSVDLPQMNAGAFVLDASSTLPNEPARLGELVPQQDPRPVVEPPASDEPAEPGTVSAPAEVAPYLAVETDGRVVLGTVEGRVVLSEAPSIEGDPVPVDVAVRPGSTVDDLTAAVLYATEAGPELGWVRVVDGEATRERFADAYQIGFDADLGHLQVPVWSPDGRHLAWTERAPDGSWRLRTIGWEDGPGTGRTADDNASTSLPLTAGDLELEAWVWGDASAADDAAAAGELWFTADRKAEVESYAIRFPIERQADGALAFGEAFSSHRGAGPQVLDVVAVGERVDLLVRRADGSFAVEVHGGPTYDVTFPMEGDGTRFDLDAVASGLVVTSRDTGGAYLVRRSDGDTRSLTGVGEEGLTAYDFVD